MYPFTHNDLLVHPFVVLFIVVSCTLSCRFIYSLVWPSNDTFVHLFRILHICLSTDLSITKTFSRLCICLRMSVFRNKRCRSVSCSDTHEIIFAVANSLIFSSQTKNWFVCGGFVDHVDIINQSFISLAVECRRLFAPVHGHILGSSFKHPAQVKFFCGAGHRLSGHSSLTCKHDGRWNGKEPVCKGE